MTKKGLKNDLSTLIANIGENEKQKNKNSFDINDDIFNVNCHGIC